MVHGEVDAFDSHERGVDKTTFDSMKQGRKLFVRSIHGGAEGTDERDLMLRMVCCRVRDKRSHFRGGRTSTNQLKFSSL